MSSENSVPPKKYPDVRVYRAGFTSATATAAAPAPPEEEIREPSRRAQTLRETERIRLSKLMSERGLCSRREADDFIARGLVIVDGEKVATLGTRVTRAAKVELAQEASREIHGQATILLNKPIGYVSAQPEDGYEPAIRLITPDTQVRAPGESTLLRSHMDGLAVAGRLDIDSTGLLILTQSGALAKKLIGEDSQVEKEYIVRVSGSMIEGGLRLLCHGLELDGEPLKEAKVEWLNPDQLRFILKEGKKRQVRRMCEAVGLKVMHLKRVRVGHIRLGALPLGCWRFLRPDENFE